jgi:hypothetical protein
MNISSADTNTDVSMQNEWKKIQLILLIFLEKLVKFSTSLGENKNSETYQLALIFVWLLWCDTDSRLNVLYNTTTGYQFQ